MFDRLKSPRQRNKELPPDPLPNSPRNKELPPDPQLNSSRKRNLRPLSIRAIGNRISRVFEREPRQPRPDPELQQLHSDLEKLRDEDRNLKEKVGEHDAEITKFEEKLQEREMRRGELDRITKELAVAQRFLSTADSLSQAEVVRAMEALNEEIFQLTSIVADKVQVSTKQLPDAKRQETFRGRILSICPLGAFLEVVEPTNLEDSLAIQTGWQAILVQWCCAIIQAWVVADLGAGELSRGLNDLYTTITSQNDHAVAGRWRALAHGVADEVSSDARENLTLDAIRALTALPVLCGYITTEQEYKDLARSFQQRMGPLLDKCLQFRKMTGEGIISTDIQPYLINSGDLYDPSSSELDYEDDEDGKSTEKRGTIACSLGLGLQITHRARGDDGRFLERREPILKPKVVLQETLREIIA